VYQRSQRHLAAHFHLFNRVVKLDVPFCQARNDETQKKFHILLQRVANCNATDDDWIWLQSRCVSCLSHADSALFDESKYIVSTIETWNHINHKKLSTLSPIMWIIHGNENEYVFDLDNLNGERSQSNVEQMYAINAEVMLTTNLWTEAGLVNGACGKVIGILKLEDGCDVCIVMVNFPSYCGPTLSLEEPSVVPITQIWTPNCKGMLLTLE
jgi:hypothetical protein